MSLHTHITTTIMEPIQIPSVFLPRVSHYHDEGYIEGIFWAFLGTQESPIHHIDLVMKEDNKNGQLYYIAFVFFRALGRSECEEWVQKFAQDIESGQRIKIIHSHPWFWNISKNTGKKKSFSRPRILSEKDEAEIREAQKAIMEQRSAAKNQAEC